MRADSVTERKPVPYRADFAMLKGLGEPVNSLQFLDSRVKFKDAVREIKRRRESENDK